MENSSLLASKVREVILDGKWIANTNYQDLLMNTSQAEAEQKVGDLNSIAALTYHINYYLAGLIQVFEGGPLEIRDKYSFDLPELNSEKDWEKLREELFQNAEKFASHVEKMSKEKLDGPFVDERYGTYRRNIEGVIEHSYYHLGQISLLKKLIKS
ncbi:MAG: DinB family protein [Bacteroidia bacterium]|nr:DinB family protein [Bacteroidia bacterium]